MSYCIRLCCSRLGHFNAVIVLQKLGHFKKGILLKPAPSLLSASVLVNQDPFSGYSAILDGS